MKRKYIVSFLIVLSLLNLEIFPSYGSELGTEVWQWGIFNCVVSDIGYNSTSGTLQFVTGFDEYCKSHFNTSIGIGLLAMKFNPLYVSDQIYATVHPIDNQSIDLIINATMSNGTILRPITDVSHITNATVPSYEIVSCIYFELYFYVFENKSVWNEKPLRPNFGPQWNDSAYSLAEESPFHSRTEKPVIITLYYRDYSNEDKPENILVPFLFIALFGIPMAIGAEITRRLNLKKKTKFVIHSESSTN